MIARLLSAVCCLLAAGAASALDWTLAEGQAVVRSDPSLPRPVMVTVVFDTPAPEGLVLRSPWGAYAQVELTRTGPLIALVSPVPGEPLSTPGEIAIPAGVMRFTCPLPGVSVAADASADADWATDLDIGIPGLSERRLALQVINPARGPAVLLAAIPSVAVGQQAVLQAQVDDPAGQGVQVAWSQVSGPSLDLGDAAGFQRVAQVLSLPTVGDYVLRCTVTDANGRAASMDVALARVRPRIVVGDTLQLAAALVDQFGDLIPAPDLAWTVDGGGSVDAQGVFSPGDVPGLRQITVSAPAATLNDVLAVQVAGLPALSWATPAPLPVGGALDATRLNAVSSVPGTFAYTPPAGTVLSTAGTISLRADFTPADADAWEPASVSNAVVVQSGDGGDDGEAGPSVPTVTLSFTAGLTGVGTAAVDGQTLSFTNHESKQVTVAATASSNGVIDGIVLTASDGRSWPLSSPGSLVVPVPDEGRLEFTATTTATRNGQSATGSTAAPLVLMVDRTPPRMSWEVAAAAAGGTAEPLPTGLIWLGGGSAADALATRTTYGVVCYPKAGFALEGTVDDLSGLAATGQQVAFVSHDGTRTNLTIDAAAKPIQVALPANAPAQATVVPATLMLQVEGDAGFEATLVDRAGNPATGRFAQLRIKDAAPLAAVGGLALNPSDGEETVINLDGWTSYTPMQTVVTSCDVIAIEQAGKHAVRLSNGPAVLGHGGHRRILWRLPTGVAVPEVHEGAPGSTVSLQVTDLTGRKAVAAIAPRLRVHEEPSAADPTMVEERYVVSFEQEWLDDGRYLWIDVLGNPDLDPWYGPRDGVLVMGTFPQNQQDSIRTTETNAVVPLADPPSSELPLADSHFVVGFGTQTYDDQRQTWRPPVGIPAHVAKTRLVANPLELEEPQLHDRLVDASWPPSLYGWDVADYNTVLDRTGEGEAAKVTQVKHQPAANPSGTPVWSEPNQAAPLGIVNAPPSWRSQEPSTRRLALHPVMSGDGHGVVTRTGSAALTWCGSAHTDELVVTAGQRTVEVSAHRTTPTGLASLSWSAPCDPVSVMTSVSPPTTIWTYAQAWQPGDQLVPKVWQPDDMRVSGGHRAVNVLRIENDVLVAGASEVMRITGGFADAWPTAGSARFIDAALRGQLQGVLPVAGSVGKLANLEALVAFATTEHGRLSDLDAVPQRVPEVMDGHQRWLRMMDVASSVLAIGSMSPTAPDQAMYDTLVANPVGAAQATADQALASSLVPDLPPAELRTRMRAARLAQMQVSVVTCQSLAAYLQAAQANAEPVPEPTAAEVLVRSVVADLLTEIRRHPLDAGSEWHPATWDFRPVWNTDAYRRTYSDAYVNALEELRQTPIPGPVYDPVLNDASWRYGAVAAGLSQEQRESILAAYADRTGESGDDPLVARFRIGAGHGRVVGLDHLAPMRQELQIQLDIGSEVVGLFDVDLKCGIVHAYPDELSQQYAGANGAHRMKEALAVVKLGYETEDQQNATVITKSHAVPKLQVNSWGSSSVILNDDYVNISLSGSVDDKAAGLVASSSLNTVYVNVDGTQAGSIPLQRSNGNGSKFAPYGTHFTFSGSVQIPKTSGTHTVELVTNLNDLGESARAETEFTVKAELPADAGGGGGSGYLAMPFQFPVEFKVDQPEAIILLLPNLDPQQPPTSVALTETGNSTLVFQSTDGLTRLTLDYVPDLDPVVVDLASGTVVLGGATFEDVDLTESAVDSRTFVAALPVSSIGGTMPEPTWSMGAVNAMRVAGGADGWAWQPYLLKLEGPSQIIDKMVSENRVYHNGRQMTMKKDGDVYYATGFADSGSGGGGVAVAAMASPMGGGGATNGNEGGGDQPMPFLDSQATPPLVTPMAKYDAERRLMSDNPSESLWWNAGGGYKAYKGRVGAVDLYVWVDTTILASNPPPKTIDVTVTASDASSSGIIQVQVSVDGKETSLPTALLVGQARCNRTSSPKGHFDAVVSSSGAAIPATASGTLTSVDNAEAASLVEYTKVQWPTGSQDWVWNSNSLDGVYAEPGWVWNPTDVSYLVKDRVPLWTLPQGEGSTKTLPETLKGYFNVTDADLDPTATDAAKIKKRAVFNAFLIEIQRGTINHWGLEKVEGGEPVGRAVFNWLVNDIIKTYTAADEQADRQKPDSQRLGIKEGQIKREFLRWPGYFNLVDQLGKFSASPQITRQESDRYWRLMGNWYFDTEKRLVDAVAQTSSIITQIADPFTYLSYMTGGKGVEVPADGEGTWSMVALDVGSLVADKLLVGAGRAAKVAYKWGVPSGARASVKAGLDALGDVVHAEANVVIAAARGGMCFTAGTKIKTSDGWKPIEQIAVGDHVWSRNEATGEEGLRPVTETFVTHPQTLVHLRYTRAGHQRGGDRASDPDGDDETELVGTPAHPFWVAERRAFVPMGQLQAGYHLALTGGEFAVVTSTHIEAIPDGMTTTTYNFSVEGWNTYFAAGGGSGQNFVWVHNLGELCETVIAKAKDIWIRKGKRMFDFAPFKNFTASQKFVIVTGKNRLRHPKVGNVNFKWGANGKPPPHPRAPGADEWIKESYTYEYSDAYVARYPSLKGRTIILKENGHPDFTPFLRNEPGKLSVVPINLAKLDPAIVAAKGRKAAQGAARALDEKAANAAAGYTATPDGYTWHHSEQLGRMELVETAAHDPFKHDGGRAIFEQLVDEGIIP
jgi:hypothetical protein